MAVSFKLTITENTAKTKKAFYRYEPFPRNVSMYVFDVYVIIYFP